MSLLKICCPARRINGIDNLVDAASCGTLILLAADDYRLLFIDKKIERTNGGFLIDIDGNTLLFESCGADKIKATISLNLNGVQVTRTWVRDRFDSVMKSVFDFVCCEGGADSSCGIYRLLVRHNQAMSPKRRFDLPNLVHAIRLGIVFDEDVGCLEYKYPQQSFRIEYGLYQVRFMSVKDGDQDAEIFKVEIPSFVVSGRDYYSRPFASFLLEPIRPDHIEVMKSMISMDGLSS